ncbi:30S ribosomal protein S4 [Candidatus Nomurabacteria bacterium RIFCSPHIGHO2_01_FULL_41_91]|uniref:Small ribosomal subunit protein uS4 n=1 Tax=Candidatus Nomurabacteria bacterium RIFCSPLOWO2_12_FULL_41_10 TaxID=1801795 RepID=A0A1F6YCW3_9BACT|nr:MAG: 30S ribosomal protein S4 [Candidatus Nomurabacteria bacterium RIFCSPHIGHO2_01_FULL_41_91]OGI80905.1 MAG: 30S ribosomal protein S4 [Candidatus Nomurabacteria bacterium RIFCSPHIGHO2_02_FULL_41_52]OGI84703.1 MAG: 30S ribosomal protein S4 [Candidatus Nomurabacteria bacterium RIFCSPHIGHO2_12_FULL_42_19]OGI93499.1 MAG: 30S ribosomal protein S4 [Candidatus Nomurabacteria bacterium RIFCSPLOWO2_01_FULL_41_52]OGI97754.1 MAG: 30S ribosomal protein S4 [Candidatus Nomurabacteria bacterium RIFCSPLOWO
MISKPKFKICRRLGPGVYDKCQTAKFSSSSKGSLSGGRRPKAPTEYGAQLIEKQKIRFSYGISERQLSNYVKKASHIKGAGTAEKLYESLESRLDNVIYRMGLGSSRRATRQMVSHGHFIVNNHRVTIPSFEIKTGDIVKIREGSKSKKIFENLTDRLKDYSAPVWVAFDPNNMEGKILAKPKKIETFLDLNAVLEFYSR